MHVEAVKKKLHSLVFTRKDYLIFSLFSHDLYMKTSARHSFCFSSFTTKYIVFCPCLVCSESWRFLSKCVCIVGLCPKRKLSVCNCTRSTTSKHVEMTHRSPLTHFWTSGVISKFYRTCFMNFVLHCYVFKKYSSMYSAVFKQFYFSVVFIRILEFLALNSLFAQRPWFQC